MKIGNKQLKLGLKLNRFDRFLIFIVSFLIVIVLSVFQVYTNSVEKSQQELIGLVMEKMSVNLKTQFESYIDDKIKILQNWVNCSEIYNMDVEEQKEFLEKSYQSVGFHHMFVVDKDGMGYYFTEDTYRNQKNEPFFEYIMSNDVYVTEPFYSNYGPTIMTACVSIYNPEHEKVGVLCGAISLESIQNLILENQMILDGNCFIVDWSGNYITSQNRADVDNKKSIFSYDDTDAEIITKAFMSGSDKSGYITLKGVRYQAYVAYLSGYNWALVQIIPEDSITERFEFMGNMQMILIILTVTLLICVIRIFFCWKKSDRKIYSDALTKCNSRAACLSILESLENQRKMDISIIYMDLNNFKYVNDTYGHDKGDELLCLFGSTLNKVFGKIGFVGRMGGDEFIAILSDVTDDRIMELCEEVESILLEKSRKLEFEYVISSSYGYATREKGQNESLDALLQKADERMYAYKTAMKEKQ